MLLVRTKLQASNIHGIGLFADQFIPAGTIVWQFDERLDHYIEANVVDSLPLIAQNHVRHFCAHLRNSLYLQTGDNDRFWNHADEPNCLTDAEAKQTVALRDIADGEELTENYFMYCESINGIPS